MIESVLIAGGIAAAGAVTFLIARAKHQARARAWLRAARLCGLSDLTPTEVVGFTPEVSGTKDGLSVKIESYKRGKSTQGTRIVVWPLDAVAPLRLRVEDFGTALQKGLGKREVEVGDQDFDRRFLIEGPAPLALAVLDAATRRLVSEAMGGRTVIEGRGYDWLEAAAELHQSKLTAEFPEGLQSRVEEHLAGALATLLGLAAHLAVRRDVPRQLADNALHDPLWRVRLANLRALARDCPRHPETARALQGALSDPSEEMRLTAALSLGNNDATLLELGFGNAPDEVSARAIAALGDHVPADRAVRAIGESIAAGRTETAWTCIEALSRHAPGADVTPAEPQLVTVLAHPDARLRIAAARALARLGTVRAVFPLQEAAERYGGELRSVSRQAVAEIQARAVGATPGQLSLTASGEGQVSLADEAAGQVSLPDDPKGR